MREPDRPTIEEIAGVVGLTPEQVPKSISAMRELGVDVPEVRRKAGGR